MGGGVDFFGDPEAFVNNACPDGSDGLQFVVVIEDPYTPQLARGMSRIGGKAAI